jgi:hypothetical protein
MSATTTTLDATLPLAQWVGQGWDLHAQQPRAVAHALLARAAALPPDDDGAAALRLAEHVLLGHLADVEGYERFVGALAPALSQAEATAPMRARMAWSLATLGGRAAEPLDDAPRWRALHGLWSVAVAQGRAQRVQDELRSELPRALAHPDASTRQALAGTCNNLAGDLLEGPRGDAVRDRLMLAAADASHALWGAAGTWVHAERAEWLLSRCHAVVGDGARALAHARACMTTIEAYASEPQADAFERFFAHEALAWAYQALGDTQASRGEARAAATLAPQVSDSSLRAYCEGELTKLNAALVWRPLTASPRSDGSA